MIRKLFLLSVFAMLFVCKTIATVVLPKIFTNGMVLQQQTTCNLWGTALANHWVEISPSWERKVYRTKSNAQGEWQVKLNTPKAGNTLHTIVLNDGKQTKLTDILVGEVWLCSGQSNMEMPLKGFKGQPVAGATEELLGKDDALLRMFTVKRLAKLTPANDVQGNWQTAQTTSLREWSATAYFFGKTLRAKLNVPVGLIVVSWGGSACEAWMRADWLKAFPTVKIPHTETEVNKLLQRCPTALYNGMLKPLVGYTIRGALWYQGEDNVSRASNYADLLKNMVQGWRAEWQQGTFPFYYCQIAPYDYSLINWHYNSAYLREQQLKAEQRIPQARMAVLMDAGLKYGIHPQKKREAGQRLAILALSNTYEVKGLPDFAIYNKVEWKGDTAVISFDRSKEWIYFKNGSPSTLFEMAGSDKVFYPARAWIERNRLYVKSDKVIHPVAVRYAFHDWADGDLFHDGLPVSSFRTDDW